LIALLWLAFGLADAAGFSPCLLKPADLAPVLGHMPLDGHPERDPLGVPMCVYEMKGESGRRRYWRLFDPGWPRRRCRPGCGRFERRIL
jgi:hypothetical protein